MAFVQRWESQLHGNRSLAADQCNEAGFQVDTLLAAFHARGLCVRFVPPSGGTAHHPYQHAFLVHERGPPRHFVVYTWQHQ